MTGNNPYPNLGFNPVPGVPENVESMKTTLDGATNTLTETNSQLDQLRNGSDGVWKGQAGEAFRAHFDNTLGTDLKLAQDSLGKAVHLLHDWHGNLVGYKTTANCLEQEMAAAKNAHTQAEAALTQANASPDLQLIGRQFSAQDLPEAQQRINNAEAIIKAASSAVSEAQGAIDSILKRAHDLQEEVERTAHHFAAALKDAAKKLAPHQPSLWDRLFSRFDDAVRGIGDWIEKHRDTIHSVLSTVSAAAGLLALITPPPIDLIAGGVALAATAGTLALDATDPKVQAAVADMWTNHNFSAANLKTIGGVGMDAIGLIPGAKAGIGLVKGGETLEVAVDTHKAVSAVKGSEAAALALTKSPSLSEKILAGTVGKVPGVRTALTDLGDAVIGLHKGKNTELLLNPVTAGSSVVYRTFGTGSKIVGMFNGGNSS